MTHASKPARSSAAGQRHALLPSLGNRIFAGLLALLLCCTLLPLGAFASSDDSSAETAAAASVAPETSTASSMADSAAPTAPASPEGSPDDALDIEADDSLDGEPLLPGSDAAEDDAAGGSQPQGAGAFNHLHYATITAQPASDGDASAFRVGSTAHASVFQLESSENYSSEPVPDDGTFSYAWYASETRSPWSLSDSDRVAGNSSSIAITDAMAGKYLFVQVSAADGTSVKGPSLLNWPNGVLRGAGPVAAAIPPANVPDPVDPTPEEPPADPDKPIKPGEETERFTASVSIVGTTPHRPGTSFYYANWVSGAEFTWPKGGYFTAWTAIAQTLSSHGYSYTAGMDFPSSVTTPDGSFTLAATDGQPRSRWVLYVNGIEVPVATYELVLCDGDQIELRYLDNESPLGEAPLVTHPQEETPEASVVWGGADSSGTGAATSLVTPTTNLADGWTLDLSDGQTDGGWSDPLIVDDRLFLATATQFRVVDRATGQVLESTPLAGALDAGGCQPLYTSGKIVVPLANGQLQAFSVSTMHCIWVSEALPQETARKARVAMAAIASSAGAAQQSTSSLYAHDGRLYAATTLSNGTSANRSWLTCLDVATGNRVWVREGGGEGFYWPGTSQLNGYILVGNPDGTLEAIPSASTTGAAAGTLQLGASSLTEGAAGDDGAAYCVTRNGVFHKVRVNSDGALEDLGSVAFAASSSSTPTLCDGKAYVGGAAADGSGVLACIDTETMAYHLVSAADGSKLPAEVSGTPVVTRQPTGTYVYFTCNGSGSGVYLYKDGDSAARAIYEPSSTAGSGRISSITTGPDGRLYCVNAAGQLMELKERAAAVVPAPDASAPETALPPTTGTETDLLNRPVNPRENLEQRLVSAEAQQLGRAEVTDPTMPIPTAPAPAEDTRTAAPGSLPLADFIEDVAMQVQDLSLVKWLLVAAGGMALGLAALLAIALPLRSLYRRQR